MSIKQYITQAWYQGSKWLYPLYPLSYLFKCIAHQRRKRFLSLPPPALSKPVIIVGNITVGGTGKTPVVAAIVQKLQQQGLQVGIISRGYGGHAAQYPLDVNEQTSALICGDEPLMLRQMTKVPVIVDPHRYQAAQYLIEQYAVDMIIADDGLQHYRLPRDIEVVVIDGQRGMGNGHCLPMGPLREPVERLRSVDFVICNGSYLPEKKLPVPVHEMQLHPVRLYNLKTGEVCNVSQWWGKTVEAVAGIGNPHRFFNTLADLGIKPKEHVFADHHQYKVEDLIFDSDHPIIMTTKDAVKCHTFASERFWCLAVEAELPEVFWASLLAKTAAVV
ncbi:tetraacyldisaccharide 4'-kinase [Zooshikella harenae]|uniref:Tetraacyldisaccharide 4'-kinase n=1 Tax=Zooshikella harenae TaxID=2827238 RepID=A0ABS5ZC33_9GAMM|nr:tetraacyldisaccharide 4'-kinase [Zooshikella harenae]MBU2711554.1 tetraacyldisaccharide 4'-kinase [Zooshikella harenae]